MQVCTTSNLSYKCKSLFSNSLCGGDNLVGAGTKFNLCASTASAVVDDVEEKEDAADHLTNHPLADRCAQSRTNHHVVFMHSPGQTTWLQESRSRCDFLSDKSRVR